MPRCYGLFAVVENGSPDIWVCVFGWVVSCSMSDPVLDQIDPSPVRSLRCLFLG